MREQSLQSALSGWSSRLTTDRVLANRDVLDQYEQNVTGIQRKIAAVLFPISTEEVVEIVRVANEFLVPLYPIGRGGNWGLGSRLPPRDHCAVVDLSRMDRIHEISVPGQYAVVEPGVSQHQLAERIREDALPLVYNVNGSGAETSVIGNALERGIGYFSSRADALSGLEVVLGTGEVLRTGFSHYPDCSSSYLYRHGHGPFLDGLFSQGNFGIVTKAAVDLMPMQQVYCAAILQVSDEKDLESFVNALATLRQRDAIQGVVHIGNWQRAQSVVGPLATKYLQERGETEPYGPKIREFMRAEGYGAWSAVIGLAGSRRYVTCMKQEIRNGLPACVKCRFVNQRGLDMLAKLCNWLPMVPTLQRKRAILPAIRELHGLSMGRPTNETLKSVYWASGQSIPDEQPSNPDLGNCGLIYVAPMLPMQGRVGEEVVRETERIFGVHGFSAYITLNLIDRKCMEAVINLCFDRSKPERVDAAHKAVHDLTSWLRGRGWYPYRLRTDEMDAFVNENDPYWQVVRQLKTVFDPNRLIAPGRYNLD